MIVPKSPFLWFMAIFVSPCFCWESRKELCWSQIRFSASWWCQREPGGHFPKQTLYISEIMPLFSEACSLDSPASTCLQSVWACEVRKQFSAGLTPSQPSLRILTSRSSRSCRLHPLTRHTKCYFQGKMWTLFGWEETELVRCHPNCLSHFSKLNLSLSLRMCISPDQLLPSTCILKSLCILIVTLIVSNQLH